MFLAKLGIGLMGTVAVGGALVSSEGFIHVRVHEKRPHSTNVSFVVPAAMVPMALMFVPKRHLAEAAANIGPYMPAMDAAIPVLEDCHDAVLVEVIDDQSHVVISKSGDSLVVDVNDRENVVHVAVPLRAARASLHQIARAEGPI